jgi:hypothetical protein
MRHDLAGDGVAAVIDRAVPQPPDDAFDVEQLVRAGRRASRRRHLVEAGGIALTAAVVVAVLGAVVGGGSKGQTVPSPATTSGATPSAPSTAGPTPPQAWDRLPGAPITTGVLPHDLSLSAPDALADYGALSGRLYVLPGARVLRWIDDPYRLPAPGHSAALELEYEGTRYFYALTYEPDGSGHGASRVAGPDRKPFVAWVRAMRGITPSGVKDPEQVNLHVAGAGGP